VTRTPGRSGWQDPFGEGVQPGDAVAILVDDPGLIGPMVQAVPFDWLAGSSGTVIHRVMTVA
jgi:hypothetical protein